MVIGVNQPIIVLRIQAANHGIGTANHSIKDETSQSKHWPCSTSKADRKSTLVSHNFISTKLMRAATNLKQFLLNFDGKCDKRV